MHRIENRYSEYIFFVQHILGVCVMRIKKKFSAFLFCQNLGIKNKPQ